MEHVRKQQIWKDIVGGRVLGKEAELAETYDMTSQDKSDNKKPRVFPIKKTGAAVTQKSPSDSAIDAFHHAMLMEERGEGVSGEAPKELPNMPMPSPSVDVTSHEPPKVVKEKKAERLALPSRGLYPLDSFTQVKEAALYFDRTFKFMPPQERHEYAENLVKRAHELDIVVSSTVEKYGSSTYAPHHDIEVCLDARRRNLLDEEHLDVLDKLAGLRVQMNPEDFALTLHEFDKAALLDQHGTEIPDAYYTTFGKVAAKNPQKEPSETSPDDAIVIGNEYITVRKLVEFVNNNDKHLRHRFGWEFVDELHKDPMGIFNSMPRDQKLVIMRMASVSDPTQGETAT